MVYAITFFYFVQYRHTIVQIIDDYSIAIQMLLCQCKICALCIKIDYVSTKIVHKICTHF